MSKFLVFYFCLLNFGYILCHHDNPDSNYGKWTINEFYDDCFYGAEPAECFGNLDQCIFGRNCRFATSIKYDSNSKDYYFRLLAAKGRTSDGLELGYVAVGLSKDQKMFGDSIVECLNDNRMYSSWSDRESKRYPQRLSVNEDSGISHEMARFVDGNILCEFHRKNVTNIRGHEFDLNKSHYILLAIGGVENAEGSLKYHNGNDRVVSKLTTHFKNGGSHGGNHGGNNGGNYIIYGPTIYLPLFFLVAMTVLRKI